MRKPALDPAIRPPASASGDPALRSTSETHASNRTQNRFVGAQATDISARHSAPLETWVEPVMPVLCDRAVIIAR